LRIQSPETEAFFFFLLLDGLDQRWANLYKKEGYHRIVGIATIGNSHVPQQAHPPRNAHAAPEEIYALALEMQLIYHYEYVLCDHRLGNKTHTSGKAAGAKYGTFVVYVAIKLRADKQDLFTRFLENKCVTGDKSICTCARLLSAYNQFAKQNNEKGLDAGNFGKKIKAAGFAKVDDRPAVYSGIRLVDNSDY
jgi:hypothetical protein